MIGTISVSAGVGTAVIVALLIGLRIWGGTRLRRSRRADPRAHPTSSRDIDNEGRL
jgi:hypothetical protein